MIETPQTCARPADTELLAKFAAGDRAALGELAGRHERLLLGLAMGMLGSRELAEEAVQDTWVRVVKAAAMFEDRSEVQTWLYRITINRCRDIARRERSQRARLNGKATSHRAASTTPADTDLRAALRSALAHLSTIEREAVLLCHHADLTHVQAASILQVPLGTLKSRMRSAISKLQHTLRSEVQA